MCIGTTTKNALARLEKLHDVDLACRTGHYSRVDGICVIGQKQQYMSQHSSSVGQQL